LLNAEAGRNWIEWFDKRYKATEWIPEKTVRLTAGRVKSDTLVVGLHGKITGVFDAETGKSHYGEKWLAAQIQANFPNLGRFKRILLLACNTGNCSTSATPVAQKLANRLNMLVIAPTRYGSVRADGAFTSFQAIGGVERQPGQGLKMDYTKEFPFREFYPGKQRSQNRDVWIKNRGKWTVLKK